MTRGLIFGLLTLVASVAQAQVDAHLKRLQGKTTWQFHTTEGIQTIKGNFDGIANDLFAVRDADGFRHYIPIDALVLQDRDLFWQFRHWTGVSVPGAHADKMASKPKFAEYVHRLDGRRTEALYERRKLNANRPPARGWTAIQVPYNPLFGGLGRPAIELGFVRQPPIPPPGSRYRFVIGY